MVGSGIGVWAVVGTLVVLNERVSLLRCRVDGRNEGVMVLDTVRN